MKATDLLTTAQQNFLGQLLCPVCGAPLAATVVSESGLLYISVRDDTTVVVPPFPEPRAATLANCLNVHCVACNWRLGDDVPPDGLPLLYSTLISYADALGWELHKTTLREKLADVAFEMWLEWQPGAAQQHADTYLASVLTTPLGYVVLLHPGEIPAVRYYIAPGATSLYAYRVFECRYPARAAAVIAAYSELTDAQRECPYAEALKFPPANGRITAPDGVQYVITPAEAG